jgi:protease I
MKMKIAFIIAFRDFRDEEYFITKEVLEGVRIEVTTFSTNLGKAIGAYGGETEVDLTIDNLKVQDFDAIVFVGGAGAYKYVDDRRAHQIAQTAIKENKVLGAICIAPMILAKAGVLNKKKATVWSSPMDRSPIKAIKEGGAIYEDKDVVVDGNIVTANGPAAARKFGEVLTELLERVK